MMSGQFESAIEFLSRFEVHKSIAVHVALVLYESHLLLLPENPHVQLCWYCLHFVNEHEFATNVFSYNINNSFLKKCPYKKFIYVWTKISIFMVKVSCNYEMKIGVMGCLLFSLSDGNCVAFKWLKMEKSHR